MKNLFLYLAVVLVLASCGTTAPTTLNTPPAPTAPTLSPFEQLMNKNPKNIILMIGDGMGLTQISAGMYMNNNKLALEKFHYIGLHKCYASDDLITDSAAAATSFACGVKTYNGAIGVDKNKQPVKTILEYAEEKGLATGLVTTSTIVHATPASFASHVEQRKMYEDIAADFMKTDVDLFIGGGKKYFDQREDGQNLLDTWKANGYRVSTFIEEDIIDLDMGEANIAYLTSNADPLPKASGRNYLPGAAEFACEFMDDRSDKGFFLMIEGAQIDWGGHANDSDYIVSEMLDFDATMKKVLEYASTNGETLVIVTADHETGGYAIQKGSKMGALETKFTSDYHTGTLIPVFAYGPGAKKFTGIYENTAIFDKMMDALKLR